MIDTISSKAYSRANVSETRRELVGAQSKHILVIESIQTIAKSASISQHKLGMMSLLTTKMVRTLATKMTISP